MGLSMRRLGSTGMEISRVGLGAWAFGGAGWRFSWGAQDDADSIATIGHALRRGVNWIDTAPVYGLGHSEEVVGKALAGIAEGERPYVFTKCGLVWDGADPTGSPRKIMSAASVRREVEASLRRLGVERIDLYQVHWPGDGRTLGVVGDTHSPHEPSGSADLATPLAEYWQTMLDLKAEGKVRAVALSNHSLAALRAAQRLGHVDVIQPRLSALSQHSGAEIAWAREHDTGVIVYQPLHSGVLTGAFSAGRVAALPEDDWRKTAPEFTTDLARGLAVADAMRRVAARYRVSVAAAAVAWTLAWPGVSGAIVGARRPAQVDDWVAATDIVLTEHDLSEIAGAAGAGR